MRKIVVSFLSIVLSQTFACAAAQAQHRPHVDLPQPVAVGAVMANSPAWTAWQNRFLDPLGRVVDDGNGGISHSEGQGYALLLAVAAADRPAFERIWQWTRANLQVRQDHLFIWRWTSAAEQLDRNNASDGDLLIAWALAEAAEYWSEPRYLQEARSIASDIASKLTRTSPQYGAILLPAARGFSTMDRKDGPVVNLSYLIFPAFTRLAQAFPEFDWGRLAASGLAQIDRAQFGSSRLPSDWTALGGSTPAPAEGFNKRFGYDAIRIPLYLFWGGAANAKRMGAFAEVWPSKSPVLSFVAFDSAGWASRDVMVEPGYPALAALARCAAGGVDFPDEFYHFSVNQHYYPATLHALAILAAVSRQSPCLDEAAVRQYIAPAWRYAPFAVDTTAAVFQPELLTSPEAGGTPAFASADTPTGATTWESGIRSNATGLILFAAALCLGRYLIRNPAQEEAARFGKAVIKARLEDSAGLIVPRCLDTDPFVASASCPTIYDQIEVAAHACVRMGRTVGLIYFEFPSLLRIEARLGEAALDNLLDVLTKDLARSLRSGDHIEVMDRHQFVIALCLLRNADDLDAIGRRLASVLRHFGLYLKNSLENLPTGKAIYPLDGYHGEDLIEAARVDYRRQLEPAERQSLSVDPLYEKPATMQPQPRRTHVERRQDAIAPAQVHSKGLRQPAARQR